MASKAPVVKIALLDILNDLAAVGEALEGMQILDGTPPRGDTGRGYVAVIRTTWESSEWATNRSRQEIFGIEMQIDVYGLRHKTGASAEAEAVELAGAIEDAIKASPTLSTARVVTGGLIPQTLYSAPKDADGWVASMEATARFTARF